MSRSWSGPKALLDGEGKPFPHPRSPCPLYDWRGGEAGSGLYFGLGYSFDIKAASDPTAVEEIVDMLAAQARAHKVVVAFDEFQDVLNIPDCQTVLALLRWRRGWRPYRRGVGCLSPDPLETAPKKITAKK